MTRTQSERRCRSSRRDAEEPATGEHLRAELLAFRSDVTAELAVVRSEFADVRAEFAAVRAEARHDLTVSTRWTIGVLLAAMVKLNSATVGLIAALR